MKGFLSIAVLILCNGAVCAPAQDRIYDVRAYEYRMAQVQEVRGSHLVFSNAANAQEGDLPLFFEFKSRAYGVAASDVASVWRGVERSSLRRSTLSGASVLAATALTDTTCAILFERSDILYLGEIDAALTLRRAVALPLTATTGSLTHTALISGINAESQATGAGTVRLLALADGKALALAIGNHLFWSAWGTFSAGSAASTAPNTVPIRYLEGYALSDIVVLNPYTRDDNDPACALLRESGLRKDVIMLSPSGKELWSQSLDVQQRTILRRVSNYTVAACTERGATAYINILKMGATPVTTGIAAKMECIAFAEEQGRVSAFAVVNDNTSGRYIWTAVRLPFGGGNTSSENLWTFPDNIIAPLAVTVFGDEFFCVFANTLVVMGFSGEPLALARTSSAFRLAQIAPVQQTISIAGNKERTLYSLRLGRDNIVLTREIVKFWWLRNIVRDSWLYAVFISIVGILLALLYIVRYQRRLLTTLFGVAGADAMFIVDAEGKLLSLNDSARSLLSIALEAPMRRLFQFYCVDEGTQNLSNFVREALKARRAVDKTITLQKTPSATTTPDSAPDSAETHDYLFSAIPIQTRFGSARGMMLIGKDITEELGKKKLGNWAQLGHDLQTNLAAIRLNAEKIAESGSSEGKSIVYQARLVQQRIKDIITVGKSEQLEMHPASAADICLKVSKEFDKILYPKVAFRIEAAHILFQCAEPQLVRALRNAVENGITRGLVDNSGIIAISAWLEGGSVWFQVRDNGRGMSPAVMRRMMNKGFTTFESKGGSGLGTMIMQYIVKAHKGEILVQSEEGNGTTVQFRLPAVNVRTLPQKPLIILPGEELEATS